MKALEIFQNKLKSTDLFDEIIDKFSSILECQKVTVFIVNENLQKNYLLLEKPTVPPIKTYIGVNIYSHKPHPN